MIKQMAILTDVTKCIGCEKCVTACKSTYNLESDKPWRWQKDVTDLSATRWTTIVNRTDGQHVRKQCRHCTEPACVSVCPVGALQKTPEGPVIYDGTICMGCRYCMMACPYGIPRYAWLQPVPYVRKCIMCYHKLTNNELEQPACTRICPTNATIFGERDELLAEAHRRLKEQPGKYIDRVWGEHEVGGTNVFYLSDTDLSFLGWKPDLGTESLPAKTWPALKIVPGVFLGVGAFMSGACWIISRRMKIAAEQQPQEQGEETADNEASIDEEPSAENKTSTGEEPTEEIKKDEAESK